MRRLWLVFAQTVTVCLGIVFIVTTLRPEWMTPAPQQLPESRPDIADTVAQQTEAPAAAPVYSYADAVTQAAPAVVSVYTRKHINASQQPQRQAPDHERRLRERPGPGQQGPATGLGSGVIMRDDGYILTNYHVVGAAEAIEITLADGRHAVAQWVGADPESDLAVVKIGLSDLTPITMGDDLNLKVGDVVLAIGNPFGVGQTTTMGIVSALGRNRTGVNIYENFIQTDAAINPGNSGGALVDPLGRLVGINTAIYSEGKGALGIGFAIPVGATGTILEQIIQTGQVQRGWLGIEPQDMTSELAQAFSLDSQQGVIVADVLSSGPAAQAGIEVGDIVVLLNDTPVVDAIQFLDMIAALEPGATVRVRVLRDHAEQDVDVRLGVRPGIEPHE